MFVIFIALYANLPSILADLFYGGITESYEIKENKLFVKRRNGTISEYELKDMHVVRSGRIYGTKSIFHMKVGKHWKPFVFEGDGALKCAKQLQKTIGRSR